VRSDQLDFVFVIDEIAELLPNHDTSVALMEATQVRGHRVLVTTASQLSYGLGEAWADCTPVTLRPAVLHDGKWLVDPEWFTLGEEQRYRLSDAAVLFMRTDPPVDAAYLRATYLLDLVDETKTLVVNSAAGVRNANEKLFGLQVPELMPPSVVTADRAHLAEMVRVWGHAVLKPTDGMAGRGILELRPHDPNLTSILDSATDRGRTQVVVQQWIDRVDAGDRRVIVLDGAPLGVVRRVATGEDFRCNMATGAVPVADTVTDEDRAVCERLAPYLALHGLRFVGLDLIGGWLTEVNVTSPTGVREIDALSGSQLAHEIIEWAEASCPRARQNERSH
jgi:glutathione synthase